jgi:hypothetical protein
VFVGQAQQLHAGRKHRHDVKSCPCLTNRNMVVADQCSASAAMANGHASSSKLSQLLLTRSKLLSRSFLGFHHAETACGCSRPKLPSSSCTACAGQHSVQVATTSGP